MLSLSEEIERMQKKLNSEDHAPVRGFRRNVTVYTLVCYLNNITGCYLSNNYEPVVVFIGRARRHMSSYPAGEQWAAYYELAKQYLELVERYLQGRGIDTTYL